MPIELEGSSRAQMRVKEKRFWSDDRFQRKAFMLPTSIFLLCLTLFPFLYSVYLSLHFVKLTRLSNKVYAGFQNYIDLFNDQLFLTGMKNTASLAVSTLTLEIVLGFIVARILYEIADRRGVNILRSAFLLPMMVTPIVVGTAATYIFTPQQGIANYLLTSLGGEPVGFFGVAIPAQFTILAINVWQWTPFMALLILAGLTSLRQDIIEAAKVDGAKWYHILFWIEIPSILPVLLLGITLRLIEILRFFDIIYITTRGGPGDNTMVMTLYTYQQGFRYFHVGLSSASAVVILLISIIVTTVAVHLLRRSE
jgi:multiple sugar transport system permease protein